MAIEYNAQADGEKIVIEGVTGPEDVDMLLELIQENPQASCDLSKCEHLHTAVLQLLLLSKISISALPESPFWQHFFNS